MGYVLPLWHCLKAETQTKLAALLGESFCPPPSYWVEEKPGQGVGVFDDSFDYAKFMKQRPIRPARPK